jgi:2,4-dienoyl-CoA reductase (NADPH2)
MTTHYSHLLAPGRIGSMTLKNRIVMTPMGSNLGEGDGSIGERSHNYYLERARGGAGLLIMGSVAVAWPVSAVIPRQVAISEERHVSGIRQLAHAVHEHGCKLALQLHFGGLMSTMDPAAGRPLWTPSVPQPKAGGDMVEGILQEEFAALAAPLGSATPKYKVLNSEDIGTLVGFFAVAAERARRADVDGVEIHAGHGYIISAFLSPATNQRTDRYGGSIENRSRLLTEVIQGIRSAVGREFPVWCRLDSQEFFQPEGISLQDAKVTAQLAEAAGADAIHASAYADARYGVAHSSAHTPQQPALLVGNAAAIKSVVGIPVIAVGRIEPELAESHIAGGQFDFVAMGRKLLADPALPTKLASDAPDSIRPCVYRYACNSQIYIGGSVRCAVNPETAHEAQLSASRPFQKKRIAVVGGGLAGMEVARRLALRGHDVRLLEQRGQLGGAFLVASRCYEPNEALLTWLINSIRKLPIEIFLNTAATPASLRVLEPDIVILALGAQTIPIMRDIDVLSDAALRDLVLEGDCAPGRIGQPLSIIGNDLEALLLADLFARRGHSVTVLDEAPQFGHGIPLVLRWRVLKALRDLGVTLLAEARSISTETGKLSYTNRNAQVRTIAATQVVMARRTPRNVKGFFTLRNEGITVHKIGDCQEVGYIDGAMRSAANVALTL